jgi:hypothetical protein
MSSWHIVLLEPARLALTQIGQFVMNVLLVILILIIGWLVAKAVRAIVTKGLRGLKLDDLSDRIGLDALLEKGAVAFSMSELVGIICYWMVMLVTFMVSINAIGLTIAADLLNRVVLYVPNVIAAIFILIVGMFIATLLKSIVQTAASNAGISQSKLLASTVEGVIIAFAIFVSLEQLQIGIRITELTLGIFLGTIGLGAALAFGLGCKDIAGRFVSELVEKFKKK